MYESFCFNNIHTKIFVIKLYIQFYNNLYEESSYCTHENKFQVLIYLLIK